MTIQRISNLSRGELARWLRDQGLNIEIGPFVTRIQSTIPSVVEGIRLLYADYPIEKDSTFADFHVRLAPPRGVRRWFRPQVLFFFDGHVPFKPLPLAQAFPFFEWGLNWCVAQHANQYLILHAAVIEKGGCAVIMPGPPGSGKSTLCAGLVAGGWRLLSDELALVSPQDGQLTPLPRPVSLKNESIDVIRKFAPSVTIGPESADTTKGTVAHMKVPDESMARVDEHATAAWVVYARYDTGSPARLERRSRAQTLLHIVRNAFNCSLLGARGFQTAAGLVDACDCYDFTYSDLDHAVGVFDTLLDEGLLPIS
jgi:HprK-related kinase A